MRTYTDIKRFLEGELPYLRERYHVDRLGVCGSYVREEEQTEESDLDVLPRLWRHRRRPSLAHGLLYKWPAPCLHHRLRANPPPLGDTH